MRPTVDADPLPSKRVVPILDRVPVALGEQVPDARPTLRQNQAWAGAGTGRRGLKGTHSGRGTVRGGRRSCWRSVHSEARAHQTQLVHRVQNRLVLRRRPVALLHSWAKVTEPALAALPVLPITCAHTRGRRADRQVGANSISNQLRAEKVQMRTRVCFARVMNHRSAGSRRTHLLGDLRPALGAEPADHLRNHTGQAGPVSEQAASERDASRTRASGAQGL